jgi:cyclopropane fatty-acyl-phospholipid synthase-like methyltransferase
MYNNRDEKSIYNNVYSSVETYATPHQPKIDYIHNWVQTNRNKPYDKVIDLGCGRGEYIRYVQNNSDVKCMGLEMSDIACKKFLGDINHECNDIKTFVNNSDNTDKFDLVYSTDVFEHLPPKDIDEILQKVKTIGKKFLFLIASGSDKKNGVELHISNHPFEWWDAKLKEYYNVTKSIKGFHSWPYIHMFECN